MRAPHFGGSGESEEAIRTRVKALNFDGSGKGEESIRRISVKIQHFGNGEKAALRTRKMMTEIGSETSIQRKSTPLGDAQGKVNRPIFDFVHFVDDVGPKAHHFSVVKTED